MLPEDLFCYMLLGPLILGPVATVTFAASSDSGLEEDCKFPFIPYSTRCINPNETIRELLASKGIAAVCSNTLTHRLVDMENGTVEFTLLLPHNAMNELIYLFALESQTGEQQFSSCSHNLHGKHSFFLLEETENQTSCSSDQLMEITWKANYVYSGCYVVRADLPSPEPETNCSSKPFYIHTDFEMEPLAYQNLSVTRKSINDTLTIIVEKELILNNDCRNPMISTSCIKIKLTSEQQDLPKANALVFPNCLVVPPNIFDCTYYVACHHSESSVTVRKLLMSPYDHVHLTHMTYDFGSQHLFANFNFGKKFHHNYPKTTIVKLSSNNTYPGKNFACCITGSFTQHCNWLRQDAGLSLECSCDWKKPQLECTFQDLPVGNYCVQVEALDTRCVRDTIWADNTLIKKMNNTAPCLWEICNLEIRNNTARYIDEPPKETAWWLIVGFSVVVVAGVCLLLYFLAKKNRVFRPHNIAEPLDIGPSARLIEPPEVLLLYARDCRPFMDAMVEFRNLLERTMNVKVFDIWDNARREDMDATGETRVLSYLTSENTPVVIMATPISRAFEEGFLSGNRRYYLAPDSRDDIFLSAFNTSIRMTATHSNRCRKFIVARMNSVGCAENILTSFNPLCTIYTLPTHLDRLLLHILNAQSLHNPLGVQRFDGPFRRKAVEFEKYVSTNLSYVDSIVK